MSIECPVCRSRQLDLPEREGTVGCDCGRLNGVVTFEYHRFPAYFKKHKPLTAQQVLNDGEATCYNHPHKVAEAACASCGMFACTLCLVDSPEGRICLSCYSRKQKSAGQTSNKRTVYDSFALGLALLPMLFVYITIITAPIVIFMVIRYWNKHPCSEVPRTRIRYILALFFALLQIAAWVFFFISQSAGMYT
ncbi:hypothetical protein [Ruficoccus sp. ZRK36]|uniref:hypothetical protein n=1 Tax=Ruficoccus sp. ZRK36 TaxID=2866311 RepID=UPI001C73A25B|nr:hypothetical protein [Ruficoccus sp. ZRK36]QYY35095.1 hypothetical protein K0V07_12390 [Ruficoccus sp. ZRK36]